MRVRATWNGAVLAESSETRVVEGNHYFPPESINREYFQKSSHHSFCPWKGQASYYNIAVDGMVNRNAAWYYPAPSHAARHVRNYVAFWFGVKVQQLKDEGEPEPENVVRRTISALFGR